MGKESKENCPSLVMAWFVCFHIHGRERDPKVNSGQTLSQTAQCLFWCCLQTQIYRSQRHHRLEVTNENLCKPLSHKTFASQYGLSRISHT